MNAKWRRDGKAVVKAMRARRVRLVCRAIKGDERLPPRRNLPRPIQMTALYFAYGSNLLGSEIRRDARQAEAVGRSRLLDHRLVFNKHSRSRGCDAANIEPQDGKAVWGFLYRVSRLDRDALGQREHGYQEVEVDVELGVGGRGAARRVRAFTYKAKERCSRGCGPNDAYLALLIEGARLRDLPPEYVREIESARFSGRE